MALGLIGAGVGGAESCGTTIGDWQMGQLICAPE